MTIEQTAYYCLSELYIHTLPTMTGAPQYISEKLGWQVELHDLGKSGIVLGGSILGFGLGMVDEGETAVRNKYLRHGVFPCSSLGTRVVSDNWWSKLAARIRSSSQGMV